MRRLFMTVAGLAAAALAGVAAAQEDAPPSGQALYVKHCSVCHQAGGVGVAGIYPKLPVRAGKLGATPEGRRLLLATVLYGMAGRLQTEDGTVVGVMPGLAKLTDEEVAAVLTHVSHLSEGSPKPFTAAEAAALRMQPPLTGAQVNALANGGP